MAGAMTRLDAALLRLERAVARLEAARAAGVAVAEPASAQRLTASEAENRRWREAAGEIAARIDNTLVRIGRALAEGDE
jgi:hypothetical protein